MDDTPERLTTDLRVLVGRLRRRMRAVADLQGLTPSQTAVLSLLDKEGAASASQLAAAERVRPQSMAATLAALEGRELVRREPDPSDGRRQLVSLTTEGTEWLAGTRQIREEWLAQALRHRFTDAERRTLAEALHLLDRLTRP